MGPGVVSQARRPYPNSPLGRRGPPSPPRPPPRPRRIPRRRVPPPNSAAAGAPDGNQSAPRPPRPAPAIRAPGRALAAPPPRKRRPRGSREAGWPKPGPGRRPPPPGAARPRRLPGTPCSPLRASGAAPSPALSRRRNRAPATKFGSEEGAGAARKGAVNLAKRGTQRPGVQVPVARPNVLSQDSCIEGKASTSKSWDSGSAPGRHRLKRPSLLSKGSRTSDSDSLRQEMQDDGWNPKRPSKPKDRPTSSMTGW
ncbi:uncharacterized protein RBU33_029584 [Hipposideros larvatus]